jgi:competence protein ComEC
MREKSQFNSNKPIRFLFLICKIFILIFVSLFLLPSYDVALAQPEDALYVTFFDVGQGDSSLLSTSKGFDILIDGGPSSAGDDIVSYLENNSIDDIEVVILSHQHADHIGGINDILESSIEVDTTHYNGNDCTTLTCQTLWAEMVKRGLTPQAVDAGDNFSWGSVSGAILNPQVVSTGDENEDSVVLDVTYSGNRILYTGDIGFSTETTLINQGVLNPIDVLKVPHLGSAYSTSMSFLQATTPKDAIISVGNNRYGHPSIETINRLNSIGASIFRTDQYRNVTFTFFSSNTNSRIFKDVD